jgi:predicted nuclease of predicted toxin-antitoxin system
LNTYIFDENYSFRFAEGLKLIEEGNLRSKIKIAITHVKFLGLLGATDEKIIEEAGKHSGIIITLDKDFKHMKHYYSLYKKHKTGVVIFRSSKGVIFYWDMVKSFINKWEELKEEIAKETFPFAFQINSKGIQKLSF